uniref:Uncharacterized protein n=1 Tax=Rhizophora mucronata TaxID=61149 RepID=A0A2P2P9N3_RHIMU
MIWVMSRQQKNYILLPFVPNNNVYKHGNCLIFFITLCAMPKNS